MADDNESTYKTITAPDQMNSADIDAYWAQVEAILTGAFNVSHDNARSYIDDIKRRLTAAPSGTRLYFYHANPFQVAADLAQKNGPVSLAEKEFYVNQIRKVPEDNRPSKESLQRLLPDDLLPRPPLA